MGRWAEVYFTNPPEKREQAVLELLRELQGENPQHEVTNAAPASLMMEPASQAGGALGPSFAEGQTAGVRCRRCGRENPASHRFCGICGIALAEQPTATGIHVADLHVADLHVEDPHLDGPIEDRPIEDRRTEDWPIEDRPIEDRLQDRRVPFAAAVYEPALLANELSLFRSAREADYRDDIFSDPPASRSYRVYVGIALATVIFALAYMALRSSQSTSGSAQVASKAQTAAATTLPAPASAPPSTPKADAPEQHQVSNEPADVPSRDAAADPTSEETPAKSGRDTTAKAAPPSTLTTEKNPPSESLAGNGAEELAVAQRYLSGSNGEPRNSVEAAKWLWKAMGKHNGSASVLLADLYLKGDGVPKNCDQARILLDSAALRGTKDAGERLRHLQAFGCN
jgi:TPR repeat protein